MNLATGQKDQSADRILGVGLLVLGIVAVLFTDATAWILERLLSLVIMAVGIYYMTTSDKVGLIIPGILALLFGGNLLVKPGEGIGILALVVGLYFVFSGYQTFKDELEGRWHKLNGGITVILGLMALWQWGDATATMIAVAVGIKLLLLGLYHNTKANHQAKHNASAA